MQPDVAAALLFALEAGPLGRRTLVERTGVTESTVRTHLNKLRERGWVQFAKPGTSLTGAGREAFAPLFRAVRDVETVDLVELELPGVQLAAHLRAPDGEASWAVRDRAIRGGADGAVLLRYDDAFRFLDTRDSLRAPRAEAALASAFPDVRPGDLVLVAFGADFAPTARGLWRMVVELLDLRFD